MDYTVRTDASGNEVVNWDFPRVSHGDFAECHEEPPTCGCDEPEDTLANEMSWHGSAVAL